MKEKKGVNKGILIVSVIATVIIVALVGVIVYLLRPEEEEEIQRDVIVREDNVDQVAEQLEKQAESYTASPMYLVVMNDEWVFHDGAAVSENAYVENNELNTNMVYFVVTLGDGEEVYHSAYMEIGSYLDEIKLDQVLEKGEYDAVITYYLVDDDFNDLSQVSVNITITIEN